MFVTVMVYECMFYIYFLAIKLNEKPIDCAKKFLKILLIPIASPILVWARIPTQPLSAFFTDRSVVVAERRIDRFLLHYLCRIRMSLNFSSLQQRQLHLCPVQVFLPQCLSGKLEKRIYWNPVGHHLNAFSRRPCRRRCR